MLNKSTAIGAVVLFTASAAGAATVAPTPATIRIRPSEAMVVLSAPGNNSKNQDYFRKVDLGKGIFVGPPILIYIDTDGLLNVENASGNQINNDFWSRPVALAVQPLPPGDYAWVESNRTSDRWVGTVCFGKRAPVYSIELGRLSIVRMDGVSMMPTRWGAGFASDPHISDGVMLAEFERARTSYPMITGEAEVDHPKAYITWPTSPGIHLHLMRNCGEPKTFQRAEAASR